MFSTNGLLQEKKSGFSWLHRLVSCSAGGLIDDTSGRRVAPAIGGCLLVAVGMAPSLTAFHAFGSVLAGAVTPRPHPPAADHLVTHLQVIDPRDQGLVFVLFRLGAWRASSPMWPD